MTSENLKIVTPCMMNWTKGSHRKSVAHQTPSPSGHIKTVFVFHSTVHFLAEFDPDRWFYQALHICV